MVSLTENKFDDIFIFCTNKAEETHWATLEKEFEKNDLIKPKKISIPDGKSESELWEIFSIVSDTVKENDKIVFDITHSFRSLPMLFTILSKYLKTIKNSEVEKIYYGAFEARDVSNNETQIFDLTPFISLYEWSSAIETFKDYGEVNPLSKLIGDYAKIKLSETRGQDKNARALKCMNVNIKKFSELVKTSRLPNIIKGNWKENIYNNLQKLEEDFLPPFKPLIATLSKKFKEYENNNLKNGFASVRWCVKNGLVQQGYTLLLEVVISYYLEKVNFHNDFYKDSDKVEVHKRNFISSLLSCYEDDPKNWTNELGNYRKIGEDFIKEQIEANEEIDKKDSKIYLVGKIYKNLCGKRNDINHAGTNQGSSPEVLAKVLNESFEELEKILI